MQSQFGDILCSIRDVIGLRILRNDSLKTRNRGQIKKKWRQCDDRHKILSGAEKFEDVLRQRS